MQKVQPSFTGKLTIRSFDPLLNKVIVKNIKTNKSDDALLFKMSSTLVDPSKFNGERHFVEFEQVKDLDKLLGKIIKKVMPNNEYSRSLMTSGNHFLYMITHPDCFKRNKPSPLVNGGLLIDFFG